MRFLKNFKFTVFVVLICFRKPNIRMKMDQFIARFDGVKARVFLTLFSSHNVHIYSLHNELDNTLILHWDQGISIIMEL